VLEPGERELEGDLPEELADLEGLVGEVARVQADAERAVAEVVEGEREGAEVRRAALQHVVRVDEREELGGEGEGEGDEGGQLALVALLRHEVEVFVRCQLVQVGG